jgi:hypothetical protein
MNVSVVPNATPQQPIDTTAGVKPRIARSGRAAAFRGRRGGAGTVHVTANATAQKPAATRNKHGNPPTAISCSPSVGASACVNRVEMPNTPSTLVRRVGGANSTARVAAALKLHANASPWMTRSTTMAGPISRGSRNPSVASPITTVPPRRKIKLPNRSSNRPTSSTPARPATPVVPMSSPTVRSDPPSARM